MDKSDAGSVGLLFPRWTHWTQEAWVYYSHDGPIGRRKRGSIIPTMDPSDAGVAPQVRPFWLRPCLPLDPL
eukprot:6592657-Pyramimonas_sp.AAC.1